MYLAAKRVTETASIFVYHFVNDKYCDYVKRIIEW